MLSHSICLLFGWRPIHLLAASYILLASHHMRCLLAAALHSLPHRDIARLKNAFDCSTSV